MDAVIHLTDPGPDHWRRTTTRADVLNHPDEATVTLIAELDAATRLTQDADTADDVVDLLDAGVRVTTNSTCLENRDIPFDAVVDGVEILDSSTRELIRLQDAGAGLVKVP